MDAVILFVVLHSSNSFMDAISTAVVASAAAIDCVAVALDHQ